MKEKAVKMEMTSTSNFCLICLLDVLGFKNLFKKEGLAVIRAKYSKLMDHVNQQKHAFDLIQTPDGHLMLGVEVSGYVYSSDSFLFWVKNNTMALGHFTKEVAEMICVGLETGLPLRGAIAAGEAILDEKTGEFLGAPIIEADETNRIQEWVGASFGPSLTESGKYGFAPSTVLSYKAHYRELDDATREFATGLTVDWPRQWRETRKSDVCPVIQSLDQSLNPDRIQKYSAYYGHTERFAAFSADNHDWFKTLAGAKHRNQIETRKPDESSQK